MIKNTFKGGKHIHDFKELTGSKSVNFRFVPKTVTIPLSQHSGAPATCLVSKNDLVKVGQKIGEASAFISANVHSSVSGKVKSIDDIMTATGVLCKGITIENDGLDEIGYEEKNLTIETFKASMSTLGKIKDENVVVIGTDKKHKFSLFDLHTFEISHDCARGLGFVFHTDYGKIALCTDTGVITNRMKEKLFDSKIFYFEANHDIDMLINGPYDYSLKQRILGEFGHISNVTSGNTLSEVVTDKCKKIYLGHLSETNNREEIAYDEVYNILSENRLVSYSNLEVAKRFENSSVTEIK